MSEEKEVQIVAEKMPVAQDSEGAMVSFIERAATDPNVDIDKFERLIALQDTRVRNEARIAFDSDMANLQADLPTIQKKGKIVISETVRSTYAKHEDINEAIKPHLKEHGFAVSFRSNFEDQMLLMTGILSHKLGHREETTMRLPFDSSGSKNNVQAIGSSVKYGQRYVLCMLLNISTSDEDDDGGALSESISAKQAQEIKEELQRTNSNVTAFLKFVGAKDVDSMNEKQAEKGQKMLANKSKKNASAQS